MLAACTAEDIVSESSSVQMDRAKLSENFVLKVGADGVESRYDANGGAPIFETGDKIGAALIDQYKYNTPVAEWPIITSLANNTPFTFNESTGEWTVPESQPMGIGNYLFKFPYDKTDRSRAAVIYTLPTVQNQYTDKDGKVNTDAAIEEANMAIAHAVLTEDDEMSNISLKNIFTYPKFRIQFDNGQKVNTVSKVILTSNKNTPAEFIVKSGFKHQAVVDLFNNDNEDYWYSTTNKVTNWDEVNTYDLIYNVTPTSDDSTTPGDESGVAEVETSKYLIAQLPADAEVSYDSNTENKYIEVRFVMPSVTDAEDLDLSILVYTDNGMYKFGDVYDAIAWKKTTTNTVKKSVFQRNKNYNLTLDPFTKVEKDTEALIVASNEDWNEIVDVYGDVKDSYDITVVGNEFGFDETTAMPSKATFKVGNDVTVKGEATLSNIIVDGNVYVEEGAELTTSATFVADAIYNEGSVIVATVLDPKTEKVVDYTKVGEIYNFAELTIEEDAEATFELYNHKDATVNNEGEINVENATYKQMSGSYGVINNDGIINLTGDFTVQYQDVAPNNPYNNENASFIYNNGEIFAKVGNLTNSGEIVNNEDAVMTCKNQDGEIINTGTLTVVDGSVTYITNNASGTIVVDKAVPAELVVKSSKGVIEYEAEGTLTFKNSIVNTIHVTDDITVSDLGAVKTICVDANAEIKLPAAASITNLTIEEDVVTSLETSLTVVNLTLGEDAELNIPADVKLTVDDQKNGTIENNGQIRVAGSLYALGIKATEAGIVKDNGTSAEVKFLNELQEAWNTAVKAWADGKSEAKGGWTAWYITNNVEKNADGQAFYAGNPYDYKAFYAVATHANWKNRDFIKALGTSLTAPQEKNGKLVETDAVKSFKAGVNNFLKTVKAEADKKLYDVNGKFKVTNWSQKNELFEVADMYDDMSTRLNNRTIVINHLQSDAVAAAYAWYAQNEVWTKVNAAYPYAYVWKSTETLACPLYDVCTVIVKADEAGWNKLFGTDLQLINSKEDVQKWLQAAAVTEATTTLGKLAKDIADKYYTESLEWEYSDDQVCECLNGAIYTLTGTAGKIEKD